MTQPQYVLASDSGFAWRYVNIVRARSHVAFYLVFAALTVAAPDTFADVFTAVTVQDDIRLVIDTNDGHSTMLQLDGEAQAFSAPAISPDGAAVGWLVHYPFCCTSYPIPLRLTILSAGTEHTFTGNGLPIWKWRFLGDGSQVAFLQQTVRGDSSVHYELRDVESGDLLEEWDSPVDRNNQALPIPADAPSWVVELNDQ